MSARLLVLALFAIAINLIPQYKCEVCTKNICEYYFEITEWITMMYDAHYPVWAENSTYFFFNKTSLVAQELPMVNQTHVIGLDGYQRIIHLINGTAPGPTIEVIEGSEIVVHVTNKMANEETTIHWHGIYQRGTPWMDGVPMLTQCGIAPGNTFTYRFIAEPAGTKWYHSHLGIQRPDGLFGALIIHPNITTTVARDNDLHYQKCGNRQQVMMVNDWFHERNMDLLKHRTGPGFRTHDQGPNALPDAITYSIDGKVASKCIWNSMLSNTANRYILITIIVFFLLCLYVSLQT